jgi:uncharacterized protein (TIGR02646 family)
LIGVIRDAGREPAALRDQRAKQAQERAARFFNSRSTAVRQSKHDFDHELLQSAGIKKSLIAVFKDRCAFCGQGVDAASPLEAHHFRPPEGAVAGDGKSSRRHYWWLAYEWKNLYLSCPECRRAQGQKFPVGNRRARVGSGPEALAKEAPLLLDPCAEDPESLLVYLDTGEVVCSDGRGKTTIETFELNRRRLVRDRAVTLEQINWDLEQLANALGSGGDDAFLEQLFTLYDRERPLAAMRRQRVNQWAQMRPRKIEAVFHRGLGSSNGFGELTRGLRRVTNQVKQQEAWAFYGEAADFYLRPDHPKATTEVVAAGPLRDELSPPRFRQLKSTVVRHEPEPWNYLDSAEIRSLEVRNFRAIEHLSLELTEGPGEGSWLMLLGENGTGKSSILQALALALSDAPTIETYSSEARHLLRKGADWGLIRVELTGRHKFRELRFGKGYQGFEADRPMKGILVAGYGATRLLPRSRRASTPRSKVKSLFDPFVPLTSPSSWLPKLEEEQFDAVARSLKRLLNLAKEETMRLLGEDVYLAKRGQRLRLADLSDGYQAMAGLGLDLMELFLRRWGSLEAAEGVVLLDELGAHLHPRWQMQVTGLLRAAFPRVQFVATTHDPLCLHGLYDGEVALLRRTEDQVYALHRELPQIEGLTVDQILTSEHFGLHSTRDPATEELLNQYYALLAKRDPSERETQRLRQLRERLDSYHLFGATRRERLALGAADDFLATQPLLNSAEEYSSLKAETARHIEAIWERRLR